MKRVFDFIAALFGLIIFLPVFIIVGLLIKLQDGGPIFFIQQRVGLNKKLFQMIKFRTMKMDCSGARITKASDSRITPLGAFLRKFKLDEIPQLINVFKGEMSFVGPRPEIPHYVKLYTPEQEQVLNYRPGITDPATISFRKESEILEKAEDMEKHYVEVIMPEKLKINMAYLKRANFFSDFLLIIKTLWLSFSGR